MRTTMQAVLLIAMLAIAVLLGACAQPQPAAEEPAATAAGTDESADPAFADGFESGDTSSWADESVGGEDESEPPPGE